MRPVPCPTRDEPPRGGSFAVQFLPEFIWAAMRKIRSAKTWWLWVVPGNLSNLASATNEEANLTPPAHIIHRFPTRILRTDEGWSKSRNSCPGVGGYNHHHSTAPLIVLLQASQAGSFSRNFGTSCLACLVVVVVVVVVAIDTRTRIFGIWAPVAALPL